MARRLVALTIHLTQLAIGSSSAPFFIPTIRYEAVLRPLRFYYLCGTTSPDNFGFLVLSRNRQALTMQVPPYPLNFRPISLLCVVQLMTCSGAELSRNIGSTEAAVNRFLAKSEAIRHWHGNTY